MQILHYFICICKFWLDALLGQVLLFSSVVKDPTFCRAFTSPRSEETRNGIHFSSSSQGSSLLSRLFLISPTLYPSSVPTVFPVDFQFQHQKQRSQLCRNCFTNSHNCIWSYPCSRYIHIPIYIYTHIYIYIYICSYLSIYLSSINPSIYLQWFCFSD